MALPPVIAGFNSSVKVPGFYGQTVFGAGPISAASVPLALLLVGNKLTGGTATPNSSIDAITSPSQADALYGAGSELALMCYVALGIPGVTVYGAPVPEGTSAVAGTLTITFTGPATASGQMTYRVNGASFVFGINSGDAATAIAANAVLAFNNNPRNAFVASAAGAVVTLTTLSKGPRANNYLAAQDITQMPAGVTSTLAGGTAVTGGITPFSGGSVVDSVSTITGLLQGQQFDRIVCAQQDSTNLALWSTFLNTMAGSTINLLDHLIFGLNGTRAAAVTLANSLNQQRMQAVLYVNGETNPSQMAAGWGATRCSTEQTDPAASAQYDGMALGYVAPQSQRADWPSNTQLNSSINNGISELGTSPNGSQALMTRSVTTHTLTGATADYRTLDTSQAYVPDFVRRDVGLLWSTSYKPNNPRVANDPASGVKEPPAGIATPTGWNGVLTSKLRKYERGDLSGGTSPVAQTVPPIIINVDQNLPVSVFSSAQQCILSSIPVIPAPAQHQIGVSVNQVG